MQLTDSDIIEYQRLVRDRHGVEISKTDALQSALSLIQFISLTQQIPACNNEDKSSKI